MLRRVFLVALLSSPPGFAAFANETETQTANPAPLPASFDADAFNRVAFEIYSHMEKPGGTENIILPNLTIFQLLGLFYQGLGEADAKAFSKALPCFAGRKSAAENAEYISKRYEKNPDISTATALFLGQGYDAKPDFNTMMKSAFGTEATTADFSAPAKAAKMLDKWVSENSKNRIKKFGLEPPANTQALFVNASTFFGEWHKPFDKKNTIDWIFYRKDDEVAVPYMIHKLINTKTMIDDKFDAVYLEYAESACADMVLIIPKSLETDISEIGFDEFKKAASQSRYSNMTVALPRFSIKDNTVKFAPILDKMKAIAIKNGINMSALSDRLSKMDFGDIISITDMTVDEEGSRITSRAYVRIRSTPGKFIADSPFKFFIVDQTTGLILFMGTVNDPSKN